MGHELIVKGLVSKRYLYFHNGSYNTPRFFSLFLGFIGLNLDSQV